MTKPAAQNLSENVLAAMLKKDGFSAWLGVEVLEIGPGKATCRMKVRAEMLNGFDVCHGGVIFSLADSAFAFAANSHGRIAMSISNHIEYFVPTRTGDVLTAQASESSLSHKIAVYDIVVRREDGSKIALFRGTVYRKSEEFFPNA